MSSVFCALEEHNETLSRNIKMAAAAAKLPPFRIDVARLRKALGNKILFVVERSVDKFAVVYYAERRGDELVGVHADWIVADNWARRTPVSENALKLFYGSRIFPVERVSKKKKGGKKKYEKGHYRLKINCLPDRVLDLRLKKSRDPTGDRSSGSVVCNALLNDGTPVGKESRLDSIWVTMTKLPPDVVDIQIVGSCNGRPVQETFVPTAAMRSGFNVTQLVRMFGGL